MFSIKIIYIIYLHYIFLFYIGINMKLVYFHVICSRYKFNLIFFSIFNYVSEIKFSSMKVTF